METQFFKRSSLMMKAMMDVKLSDLTNARLLDYHRKCHMLYGGNIKHRPLNKEFINSIVDLHDRIVKVMLKRHMKHNTPLIKV